MVVSWYRSLVRVRVIPRRCAVKAEQPYVKWSWHSFLSCGLETSIERWDRLLLGSHNLEKATLNCLNTADLTQTVDGQDAHIAAQLSRSDSKLHHILVAGRRFEKRIHEHNVSVTYLTTSHQPLRCVP